MKSHDSSDLQMKKCEIIIVYFLGIAKKTQFLIMKMGDLWIF